MANDLRLQVVLDLVNKASAPLRNISKSSEDAAKALRGARDTLKRLNDQQKAIDEFNNKSNGFREASNKVRVLKQNLDVLRATQGTSAKQIAGVEKELAKASKAYDKQRDTVFRLRNQLTNLGVTKVSDAQRKLKTDVEAANKAYEQQEAKLKAINQQKSRLYALNTRHSKDMIKAGMMTGTGFGLMASGRAAGGAIARFAAPSVEFDATMSRVQALTRLDKNSPQLAALRQQAKDLGASTSFSGSDVASGQAFLAMAGFTHDAIRAAMPGLLDMSKAGDIDLGRGADISSNILSAFGIDPANMDRVADVLTRTFTTANVNLEMLGGTMKYVAPIAKQAGMSFEEASAMAGLMGNIGIQDSMAGTALRAMVNRLAAPAKSGRDMLEELGVSAKDAQGNMRSLPQVLYDVAKATENMGSADRLRAIKEIFGEEAAAGMADLIQRAGSDELRKYVEIVQQSKGAASAVATTMGDNLQGDLKGLASAWEALSINAGEANGGWMRDSVQWATSMLRGVAAFAQENPRLVRTITMLAAAMAVLLTVSGGLLITVGLLYGKVMLTRFLLARLGLGVLPMLKMGFMGAGQALLWIARTLLVVGRLLLLNPIGLAITGIALAAYLIYQYWGPITAFFGNLWANIKTGANGLWESFKQFGGMLMDGLIGGITNRLAAVKNAIVNVADSAVGWFKEKLGIRSPSRVFMQSGEFLGEGAAIGIRRSTDMVRKASVGMAAAATIGMAGAGEGPRIDQRPPLQAGQRTPSVIQGDTITIQITAAPGADPQALARAISAELDKRARAKAARGRSALGDVN